MAYQPRLLKDSASTRKHNEVRNTAHLKAGGELGIGFGVHLKDDGLTRHVSGCAGNLRSRGPAWTTPTGPEIYQNGHSGVLDNIVKGGGVDGKRLSERRKLGLASSTSTARTEMFRRDSVLLLAVSTCANDRHD